MGHIVSCKPHRRLSKLRWKHLQVSDSNFNPMTSQGVLMYFCIVYFVSDAQQQKNLIFLIFLLCLILIVVTGFLFYRRFYLVRLSVLFKLCK